MAAVISRPGLGFAQPAFLVQSLARFNNAESQRSPAREAMQSNPLFFKHLHVKPLFLSLQNALATRYPTWRKRMR